MSGSTPGVAGQREAAPSCKLCGAATGGLFGRSGFRIVRCRKCGFHFALIADSHDLGAVYRDEAYWVGGTDYGCADGHQSYWRTVRPFYEARIKKMRRLGARGSLLEIGAADGRFLAAARAAGFEVTGVELSPLMRRRCAERLGCQVYESIEAAQRGGRRFDCVAMFEVIEHVPDPLGTLRAIGEMMAAGGLLALSTPNFDCERARRTPDSFAPYSPPVHVCYFGAATLADCVARAGFKTLGIEACFAGQEMPMPAAIAAILRPLRRGKRLRPGGLIGRALKAHARRRALRMARHPDAIRLGETLELYARKP